MITTTVSEGVTIVALDRPRQHNALVPELARALVDAVQAASAGQQPLVLTGNGAAFCPGADLKWLARAPHAESAVATLVADHHLAITTLLQAPVPTIAAINGAVAGGGLGLALAADFRVADPTASFTAGYLRLGLTPDGGTTVLLPATIGRARTLDMLFSNRSVGADEALAWGLVNEVCAPGQCVARAVALAHTLVSAPGYAIRHSRALLDTDNLRNQLQLESVAIRTTSRGESFREALERFAREHPA